MSFQPKNDIESMLLILPKQCCCDMCSNIKKEALETLGEKRFKEICKILGICA